MKKQDDYLNDVLLQSLISVGYYSEQIHVCEYLGKAKEIKLQRGTGSGLSESHKTLTKKRRNKGRGAVTEIRT